MLKETRNNNILFLTTTTGPTNLIFTIFVSVVLLSNISILAQASVDYDEMVYIPAGEFLMGTSPDQAEVLAKQYNVDVSIFTGAEHPLRKVYVEAFYIDKYEVTNRKYQEFVDATGHAPSNTWRGSTCPKELLDCPVTGVTWQDANSYAQWAGKKLPSEAQWEKAARGVDGRLYPWGNQWRDDMCRMDTAQKGGDAWGLAPVGSYPGDMSPYGVMDMAGNIAEWTNDLADMTGWAGFKIFKGGSWEHYEPYSFRCASRVGTPPTNSSIPDWYIGFRCVKDTEVSCYKDNNPVEQSALPENKPAVKLSQIPMPKPELYLKKPLQLFKAGFKVGVRIPYLPGNEMNLNVLEGFEPKRFEYVDDRNIIAHWVSEDKLFSIDVTLKTGLDYLDTIYVFKNMDNKPRSRSFSICCETYFSPLFKDHEGARNLIMTKNGPKSVNNFSRTVMGRSYYRIHFSYGPNSVAVTPFTMTVSRDGEWIVSQVSKQAAEQFNNLEGGCQHSVPNITVQPKEEKTVKQRIYVMRGSPEDLVKRWQNDFVSK